MGLAYPAPAAKTATLRKRWLQSSRDLGETLPLDDDGAWVVAAPPDRSRQVRPDAPADQCPAFEVLDLAALAAPRITEYAGRTCSTPLLEESCGPGQDTLGQAQMLEDSVDAALKAADSGPREGH